MWCCQEEPAAPYEDTVVAAPALSEPPPTVQDKAPKPTPRSDERLAEPAAPLVKPAAPLANVSLSLDRSNNSPLGLILDKNDEKNLTVVEIKDGGLFKAAAEAEKKEIRPGFRIAKVNGTAAAAGDLVTLIRQEKALEVELEAFQEYKLNVRKNGQPLGMGLAIGKGSNWVTVKNVAAEGVIPSLNAAAALEQKVMASDKIIAVDGQAGTPQEMVSWITERESMELTIYSWKSLHSEA